METLVIYWVFLYLMTKLILNAIEQEKWWLAVSLMITMIGAIFYHHWG